MHFTCRPVDTSFFDTAPMRFKNEVELDAPPAKVFAIFDDERSWPEWFRAIHKVVWTTLTGPEVLATLLGYILVYMVIFAFGMYYIYALLREGPTGTDTRLTGATGMRPMAAAGPAETATGSQAVAGV
jgi:hypothetical protein